MISDATIHSNHSQLRCTICNRFYFIQEFLQTETFMQHYLNSHGTDSYQEILDTLVKNQQIVQFSHDDSHKHYHSIGSDEKIEEHENICRKCWFQAIRETIPHD